MSRRKLGPAYPRAICGLFRSFCQNQAGNYVITFALALPVLVGLSGLGTEAGLWFFKQQTMQGVADSSALSAATANNSTLDALVVQADGVAATYGYANGVNGVQVTVNRPPKSGSYTGTTSAIEVIVRQPQQRLLSRIYRSDPVLILARAVATPSPGQGCVLALDPSVSSAAALNGSAVVNLKDCGLYSNSQNAASSIQASGSSRLNALVVRAAGGVGGQSNMSTSQGIFQNQTPTADPYANVDPGPKPSTCTKTNYKQTSGATEIGPGRYCGGLSVQGGTLKLQPGIYWIDGGSLKVNGGATLEGKNVTLVFTGTGSDYADAAINGGANVNLTAPTTGPTAGIVIFADRNTPTSKTFKLNGGSTQYFGGAIYTSTAALDFTGGSGSTTSCTQIVARTVTFSGNANLALNCAGSGVKPLGSSTAMLVE
jgi:Putative Flp pilus-assembly TadE/G-like